MYDLYGIRRVGGLTVIVPTCGKHFLGRALSSVTIRTRGSRFILCVNSSTDPRELSGVIRSCRGGMGLICRHFDRGVKNGSLITR